MKNVIVIGLMALCAIPLKAQDQQPTPADSLPFDLQKNAFIYTTATRYSDPIVARMALYNILAYNPANIAVLDSLALSYIDYQQWPSAVLASQDALKVNPDDALAMEIAAVAYENLGLTDRALPHYESLYLKNEDVNTLYKIAFLQFNLKRYTEAATSADILMNDSKTLDQKLVFQKNQQENQEVPMIAAIHRLKGMIEADKGNVDEAKVHYTKALEVAPDFAVVKLQLEELNKG
ncbi:MAG: hypothetical protein AAGA85_10635 [Bacteroidota bacterium]